MLKPTGLCVLTPGQLFEYIRDYAGEIRLAMSRGDNLTISLRLNDIEACARELKFQAEKGKQPR